jgi:hypothetical protein
MHADWQAISAKAMTSVPEPGPTGRGSDIFVMACSLAVQHGGSPSSMAHNVLSQPGKFKQDGRRRGPLPCPHRFRSTEAR